MKKLVLKKREIVTDEQQNQSDLSSKSKKYKINYAEELNTQQLEAVMHNSGPALVIAGAGTGKTRTLVYRIARLIEDGVSPDKILLITFTRKAANELKQRITSLLDERASRVQNGTFHSLAFTLLRQYADKIGFGNNFNLLDDSDAAEAIEIIRDRIIKKNNINTKIFRFPQKSALSSILSKMQNKRLTLNQVLIEDFPKFVELEKHLEKLFEEYKQYKLTANIMDYDDLLHYFHLLIKNNKSVLNEIHNKYKFIMVDEYQDTNRIQHEIVLLLSEQNSNVMVVGDDAQSIYSFRGAEHNNILFFPNSFENCVTYKIEENYRSNDKILDFTNFLINQAPYKYDKNLFTSSKISEDLVKLITCKSEKQQSAFVVQQILEYRENGVALQEIAVLFRSGFHSFDLEIELDKANIPFKKFGGIKFIETAHIKDVLSIAKLVHNPKDLISWNRILKLLKGIGKKKSDDIINLLSKVDFEWRKLEKSNLEKFKSEELIELFHVFSFYKVEEQINIPEMIKSFSLFYKPILEANYDDSKKRWRDIETFWQISESYKSLSMLINDISIDPPSESVSELLPEGKEDEFVSLSTIHSSKGLEWKIVFLIWALEGKFPSSRSVSNQDDIEEERRLFYVACTRAKDELLITYPTNIFDRESGFVLSEASRFLNNLSDEIVDKYVLVEE